MLVAHDNNFYFLRDGNIGLSFTGIGFVSQRNATNASQKIVRAAIVMY